MDKRCTEDPRLMPLEGYSRTALRGGCRAQRGSMRGRRPFAGLRATAAESCATGLLEVLGEQHLLDVDEAWGQGRQVGGVVERRIEVPVAGRRGIDGAAGP